MNNKDEINIDTTDSSDKESISPEKDLINQYKRSVEASLRRYNIEARELEWKKKHPIRVAFREWKRKLKHKIYIYKYKIRRLFK